MTSDGSVSFQHQRTCPIHYYGDTVRILFIIMAVVLLIGETAGADFPFSPGVSIMWALVFAIIAGITNPKQKWIHWVNGAVVVGAVYLFGTHAITHYRADADLFSASYFFPEGIAVLSLIALYFATKTIRGLLLCDH